MACGLFCSARIFVRNSSDMRLKFFRIHSGSFASIGLSASWNTMFASVLACSPRMIRCRSVGFRPASISGASGRPDACACSVWSSSALYASWDTASSCAYWERSLACTARRVSMSGMVSAMSSASRRFCGSGDGLSCRG